MCFNLTAFGEIFRLPSPIYKCQDTKYHMCKSCLGIGTTKLGNDISQHLTSLLKKKSKLFKTYSSPTTTGGNGRALCGCGIGGVGVFYGEKNNLSVIVVQELMLELRLKPP